MKSSHHSQSSALARVALAVLAGLMALAGLVSFHGSRPARAIAPCVAWNNTSEELDFLAQLQAWRNANLPGSKQLVRSAPLNAAAAGYAQFLATSGGSGHFADGSDMWARAQNCGFTSNGLVAAGGEGLGRGATASAALAMMVSSPGSGIYYPNADCVGVAKAQAATDAVWIVLVMRRLDGNCPQAVTGGTQPPPLPTDTPTASPTATATHSPTVAAPTATPTFIPTATPTPLPPTPVRHIVFAPGVCAGCLDNPEAPVDSQAP